MISIWWDSSGSRLVGFANWLANVDSTNKACDVVAATIVDITQQAWQGKLL